MYRDNRRQWFMQYHVLYIRECFTEKLRWLQFLRNISIPERGAVSPVVGHSLVTRAARVRSRVQAWIIRCKNLALYIGDCESLCLSDETVKSRWSLLSGVYARGSKISHTGGKCVTCRGLRPIYPPPTCNKPHTLRDAVTGRNRNRNRNLRGTRVCYVVQDCFKYDKLRMTEMWHINLAQCTQPFQSKHIMVWNLFTGRWLHRQKIGVCQTRLTGLIHSAVLKHLLEVNTGTLTCTEDTRWTRSGCVSSFH